MTSRIIGTGSCLPKNVVTNQDLAAIMDTSDEWIQTRTGIKERRLVKEETTASMCIEAAQKALINANIVPEDIDLILVATITGDYITPSTACQVQAVIGAVNAIAMDLNGACSGFLFALNTAHAYLQAEIYNNVLIIGAETLSKIMDWSDRSTCVLFGDGAGAVIIHREEKGLIAFEQGSDGSKGMVLSCKGRENHNLFISNPLIRNFMQMNGREVYKFAVNTVPKSIQNILSKADIRKEEVDYYILHQANFRIIQSIAKRLNLLEEKFPINLNKCGNISAASIPILLDEMNQKGKLERGMKLILSGFGAGLTWATVLIEW